MWFLHWGEETVVQAVVGSIVCVFRKFKKPRFWEMSARGYALHSVCPWTAFLLFHGGRVTKVWGRGRAEEVINITENPSI